MRQKHIFCSILYCMYFTCTHTSCIIGLHEVGVPCFHLLAHYALLVMLHLLIRKKKAQECRQRLMGKLRNEQRKFLETYCNQGKETCVVRETLQ